MKTRQEIKQIAKERLRENRGNCIGVYVLFVIAASVLGGVTMGLAALVLMPVLTVAVSGWYLRVYRGENLSVSDWFTGMFDGFGRKWLGMFWMGLKVFLWSLLFLIPGIIKGFAYFLTPYILAEYPNVAAKDATVLSDKMTKGYKMDIFVAELSFLGWILLSALTFGILQIVHVGPYMNLTFSGIYEELKQNALANGTVKPEELEDGAVGTVY